MIKAVKGTRDILPPASSAWNHVEAVARKVFRTYNYQEIRTPLFEETALFARGVGEDTDIVGKEMYTWEDRDGSSLTLRPEATASVMRAYIEHRLDQIPGVKKFYYMGPMFRRERPQKGRFRQFFAHDLSGLDVASIGQAPFLGAAAGGRQGHAAQIVDKLRVNVLRAAKHGQPRSGRVAANSFADAKLPPLALS